MSMAIPDLRLHIPHTLPEALSLLGELEGARAAAGGTDLFVDFKEGLVLAGNVVSLHRIAELKRIELGERRIRIGALVTPEDIIASGVVRDHLPALVQAASSMANPRIRTMATIGGNIVSAVPSADLPPPLIAAGALLELRSADSSREVPLAEFFLGPRSTVRRREELLTFVILPLSSANTGISYQRFGLRGSNALAVASVAAALTLEKRQIVSASIVLGAVAPTALQADRAASLLIGKEASGPLFQEAAASAQEEARPISDIRGSAWFRRELIRVLTQRALAEALDRISQSPEKAK